MLEPQEKIILQRMLDLTEKNNSFLTKLYSAHRWTVFFHIIYWVLVVGAAVGAYYYIQPYVETISGGFSESVEKVQRVFDAIPTE